MFSQMSYHVWRFMAFKPNDQSYGHIHGTVFFKWSNIVHKGAYWNGKHWCLWKFSFSLDEKFVIHFFVKDLPYICCKIGPNQFYKILAHIQWTIDQMVGCKIILSTYHEKDKFAPIQLEVGQVWTKVTS